MNLEDPNIRGYDAIRRLFLIEIAKHATNGDIPVSDKAGGLSFAVVGGRFGVLGRALHFAFFILQ